MKVGVFCEDILPTQGGGYTLTQEILRSVAELASQSSHEIVVLSNCLERPQVLSAAPHLRYLSTQATEIESKRYKWTYLRTAIREILKHPRNFARVKTWKVQFVEDLLHTHQIDFLWHVSSEYLSMAIPYIMTVWDLAHLTQPYFPEVSKENVWHEREYGRSPQEPGYTITLRRAAYILTGTEAGKAEIERFYQVPPSRIQVVPFPVPRFAQDLAQDGAQDRVQDRMRSDAQVLEQYGLESGYLFYPAQFWAHKNHVNLLLALQALRDRHQLIFTVVFSGSDKGTFSRVKSLIEELGLVAQVHFLGFVPQSDLAALYRNAFALTFASFFGPDNLPPLEAFSLRCPVLAAKVPGVSEQLGDAALLFDPQDPDHIADTVKQLWDSPDLRETLIERGLLQVAQRSSADYVQDVFGILNEFAAVRRCW